MRGLSRHGPSRLSAPWAENCMTIALDRNSNLSRDYFILTLFTQRFSRNLECVLGMTFARDHQKLLIIAEFIRLYCQLRAVLYIISLFIKNSTLLVFETNGKWLTSKQNDFASSDVLGFRVGFWSLPASLSLFCLFQAASRGRFSPFPRHWWPVSFLPSPFFKQISNWLPPKPPVTKIWMCLELESAKMLHVWV